MTAVEWLESKFYEFETIYDSLPSRLYEYVEQAKEMERRQLIDFAVWFNNRNNEYQSYDSIVEQYYNEQFKKGTE